MTLSLPIGVLGQVWCLIVSIPDLCHLSYFTDVGLLFFKHTYYEFFKVCNFTTRFVFRLVRGDVISSILSDNSVTLANEKLHS